MKKLLVTTLALSLTFAPLAKAENIQDEVPRTLGQNIDAMIAHSKTQLAVAVQESQEAAIQLRELILGQPLREAELSKLKMRLKAFQSAKEINSEDHGRRFLVSMAAFTTIAGPTYLISQKMNSKIAVISKLGTVGKVTAVLVTFIAGMTAATVTGSVLILSPEELQTSIEQVKIEIAQLEATQK